ncbi:MAG: hypothetical protein BGO14_07375 [Chlamydiales bacterium 38-26]|nr:glycosyltransferase family 25 protein [Chlamydiales bacterium]OJV10824.1 MAG: hypothetical protein BGO14_07375 [Chlamydiales bacterium 38-26]
MNENPHMYVINLDRRPDRWERWMQQVQKWNVPHFERFKAVDGATLEMTAEIKFLFRNNNFNSNPFGFGCALSHFLLWMQLVETQAPYYVIFEDDAQFSRPFKLPSLPEDWDLFYFGGVSIENCIPPGIPYKEDIVMPKLEPYQNLTTVAYMISLKGALTLMQIIEKKGIDKHADKFLMSMHRIMQVYCYSPMLVYADKSYGSDVFCEPTEL